MNVAYLFPGQGSQVPGMLHALPDHPTILRTLDQVSETLKQNVLQLDSSEALRSTVSVQLALLASGVALARTLIARGVEPGAVAGMSAGTFSAAVTVGVLELADGVRLLRRRAKRMLELYPKEDKNMRSKGSAEIHHNAREHNSYRNSGSNYVPRRILTGIFLTLTLSSPIWGQKADKKSLGTNLVPAGTPYSPAILVGNTLYVSGLQGTDPHTHKLPQDFRQEVRNCLGNVGQVLKEAGMDYSDVISAQIFLVDMAQFKQVNSIYKEHFKAPFPSRTTVQVAKLSLGAHVEIAVVAQK